MAKKKIMNHGMIVVAAMLVFGWCFYIYDLQCQDIENLRLAAIGTVKAWQKQDRRVKVNNFDFQLTETVYQNRKSLLSNELAAGDTVTIVGYGDDANLYSAYYGKMSQDEIAVYEHNKLLMYLFLIVVIMVILCFYGK